jgi:dTDP-4-dehydrorhamnose 3,5-epimerase
MKITPLKINGAWMIDYPVFPDSRGMFREWFTTDSLVNNGLPDFQVRQANTSTSNKGVIRGIHYSSEENGQTKLVTCTAGSILDVIVDLRPRSENYGMHLTVELHSNQGRCLFIPSGLGHAFQALEENTVVTYLLDKEYSPKNEFGLNPIDPEIGILWPLSDYQISEKDLNASNFNELNYGEHK